MATHVFYLGDEQAPEVEVRKGVYADPYMWVSNNARWTALFHELFDRGYIDYWFNQSRLHDGHTQLVDDILRILGPDWKHRYEHEKIPPEQERWIRY